mgnify:CR=1 FL=1
MSSASQEPVKAESKRKAAMKKAPSRPSGNGRRKTNAGAERPAGRVRATGRRKHSTEAKRAKILQIAAA